MPEQLRLGVVAAALVLTACAPQEPERPTPARSAEGTPARSADATTIETPAETSDHALTAEILAALRELEESTAFLCVALGAAELRGPAAAAADFGDTDDQIDEVIASADTVEALTETVPEDGWLAVSNSLEDAATASREVALAWSFVRGLAEDGATEDAEQFILMGRSACDTVFEEVEAAREGLDAVAD